MAERIYDASWSNASNILMNHDFSDGLNYWHLVCCNGHVISADAGDQVGISMDSDQNYAVITKRNEWWQGLEQDITDRISIGSTYRVTAFVGVSGPSQESAEVKATLKLEYDDSATQCLFIGRYKRICNFITFTCFKEIEENALTCLLLFSTELQL
jgi:hypothetical protein